MIEYVAPVSVSKKLYDVILPRTVTILEMSNYGSGYRVYFGQVEETIVLLLIGGDKSTQEQDISKAKTYWTDYRS